MTRKLARFPHPVRVGGIVVFLGIGASVSWGSCSVYDESLLTGGPDSSAGTNGSGGSGASGGAAGSSGEDGGGSGGTSGTDGVGGTSAGGSAGVNDGGCTPTTGPWWAETRSSTCHATGRPKPEDRPSPACEGESIPPIIFATSRIRLGNVKPDLNTRDDNAWKEIGLDLDQSCSRSISCLAADAGSSDAGDAGAGDGGDGGPVGPLLDERSCKTNTVNPPDGLECRDNTLGGIYGASANSPIIGGKFFMNEKNWNCALHRGEFSTLIRISEYNGTPDDPRVRVDNYTSVGQRDLPQWECVDSNGVLTPNWQGFAPWTAASQWLIARRSLSLTDPGNGTELPASRFGDANAYVRGGYVVARLPNNTELWLNGQRSHAAGFRNVINRAVTIGKLVKADDGTWRIEEGIISGVTFPTDVVQAFREIGYCENFCGSYRTIIDYVNLAQDSLLSEDKLPSEPCETISMGIEFTARQIMAGPYNLADILVDSNPPGACPDPRDPTLPRQGCTCQPGGGCTFPDGGADAGGDR